MAGVRATVCAPSPGETFTAAVDLRFRKLLGEDAWLQLPPPVRNRFSKRMASGEVALYRGNVVSTEMSAIGRLLSFVTRFIGAPLPTMNRATGPAIVAVTEDATSGGQRWLRIYERPGRRPQMIQSTKRFRGSTGLEEYVGAGISMELAVGVENTELIFRSRRYLIGFGDGFRVSLPAALAPGDMTIIHRQNGDGSFTFSLTLQHRMLGRLLHQVAIFNDV